MFEAYPAVTTITLSTIFTLIAVISVFQLYRKSKHKNRIKNKSERIPVFKNSVELIWKGKTPCFCRDKIVLNIESMPPHTNTYHCITIAHIFGIKDVKHLIMQDNETGLILNTSSSEWNLPMISGKTFLVDVDDESYLMSKHQIKEIATLLGTFEKTKKLSLTFYNRIWNDSQNDEFRQHFTQNVANPEQAADNQSRWLWEMWGGQEATYSSKYGKTSVFKRMLSRHDKSRMSFDNACIWLTHMKEVIMKIYDEDKDKDLINNLSAYWLHFFAFFEYSPVERHHFQRILFEIK